MSHINIEIKARVSNPEGIRSALKLLGAEFKGVDYQTDTYFNVQNGRLKLREGNIENYLIYYERENKAAPKQSNVVLSQPAHGVDLKEILTRALGILIVVKKRREIYFIENVKFHLDELHRLGTFLEIEAIDTNGTIVKERLMEQCGHYLNLLGIPDEDLVSDSYSDLLMS